MKGNSEVQEQRIESLYRQFTPPDWSTYRKTVYSRFSMADFATWAMALKAQVFWSVIS